MDTKPRLGLTQRLLYTLNYASGLLPRLSHVLGNDALEHKNLPMAIRAYSAATQANPQSEWAWQSLAVAQASSAARKETFNALSRARELTKDKSHFAEWLQHEPAFDRFRGSTEFQVLQKSD